MAFILIQVMDRLRAFILLDEISVYNFY